MTEQLSHLSEKGAARMVDVSGKKTSMREAVAEGLLLPTDKVWEAICKRNLPKGELWNTARVAGILAAKRTDELIPMCHSLQLSSVHIEFGLDNVQKRVVVKSAVAAFAATGVEMEALTATSVALLTLYDMLKALDKGIQIGPIRLVKKSGGKSGPWLIKEDCWFDGSRPVEEAAPRPNGQ